MKVTLLSAAVLAQQLPSDPDYRSPSHMFPSKETFGGLDLYPSLKVRISQGVTEMFRENLSQYGRSYLNTDLKIKDNGKLQFNMFPLFLDLEYFQLHHSPIQLDLSTFALDFTQMKKDHAQVVYLNLPLINHWSFDFGYHAQLGYIWPLNGQATVKLENTYALATFQLEATKNGVLYPQLHDLYVDFGDSIIVESHPVRQYFFRQTFNFFKYIVMDSINRFGKTLYNGIIPKLFAYYTNDMSHVWHIPPGQFGKSGDFKLDYRLTSNPRVFNQILDLDFFFDIGPDLNHCNIKHEDIEYQFDNFDPRNLQVVVSDRVPNCILDAMQRLDWYSFKVNSDFMAKHLGTHAYPITARQFSEAFPFLAQSYGPDTELDVEIQMNNPRVFFGPKTGDDIHFQAEIKYGIKLAGDLNYILYDTVLVQTNLNVEITNEVLFANFAFIKVTPSGDSPDRTSPIFTAKTFTPQDYVTFWKYADKKAQEYFMFFNEEVFNRGVPLPYWKLSFLTTLDFHPRAMTAVISLFYN